MDPKFGYFADFCDHRLTTVSAHTYTYYYPLFESGTEQSLYAEKIEYY